MALDGVVDFIDHTNIPGYNSVTSKKSYREEIFSSGHVHYAGQSIGLIVATSSELAHKAARMVLVSYTNMKKPLLDIKDVVKMPERVSSDTVGEPIIDGDEETELAAAANTVTGEFQIGSQYHFHLETQTCVVTPEEDGVRVVSSTQYMDAVQRTVAATLGIKESDVNISVRRLGGGFGKIPSPFFTFILS